MAESTRLVDLVQARIDQFLGDREPLLSSIAPELEPFIEYPRELLRGGKRFRALFCYWGWQAVSGQSARRCSIGRRSAENPDVGDLGAVVLAASALEMFHAAALVHDDIIDNSDTRRGAPSAHRLFVTAARASRGWDGSAAEFGASAASCSATCCWCGATSCSTRVCPRRPTADAARAARAEFNRMRTEVTPGSTSTSSRSVPGRTSPKPSSDSRAERVIVYKSAKYSVEAPLAIGARPRRRHASPSSTALREFGLPLGIAYQLRDDLLGVFGDPEVTGKPARRRPARGQAHDAHRDRARTRSPPDSADCSTNSSATPSSTAQQVRMLQRTIRECGAVDQVERIIAHNVERATEALMSAPVSRAARDELGATGGRGEPPRGLTSAARPAQPEPAGSGERLRDPAHLGLAAGQQRVDRRRAEAVFFGEQPVERLVVGEAAVGEHDEPCRAARAAAPRRAGRARAPRSTPSTRAASRLWSSISRRMRLAVMPSSSARSGTVSQVSSRCVTTSRLPETAHRGELNTARSLDSHQSHLPH